MGREKGYRFPSFSSEYYKTILALLQSGCKILTRIERGKREMKRDNVALISWKSNRSRCFTRYGKGIEILYHLAKKLRDLYKWPILCSWSLRFAQTLHCSLKAQIMVVQQQQAKVWKWLRKSASQFWRASSFETLVFVNSFRKKKVMLL